MSLFPFRLSKKKKAGTFPGSDSDVGQGHGGRHSSQLGAELQASPKEPSASFFRFKSRPKHTSTDATDAGDSTAARSGRRQTTSETPPPLTTPKIEVESSALAQDSPEGATEHYQSTSERRWPQTTVNGLKLALRITKEAAGAFPPLEAVASGLLVIADVVQRVSGNEDDLHILKTYIDQVNKFISPDSLPPVEQWPASFTERLSEFDRGLQTVVEVIRQLDSEKLPGRVLNVEHRANKISDCVKSVSWLVQCFTVRGTISIEFAVDRVEGRIDEGLQHIDGRFDGLRDQIDGGFAGVREHLDVLKDHIDQQSSSSVPGLRPVIQAQHDHFEGGRSECETGTRLEALATIYSWIQPGHPDLSKLPPPIVPVSDNHHFMWMYALAGAGKTTLTQTTAQWCRKQKILGATFFCGSNGGRNNVQSILPTIAHQLTKRCPLFRDALIDIVRDNPEIHQMLLTTQLEKLIVEPLQSAIGSGSTAFEQCVVIIDALDECTDDEAVSIFLKALSMQIPALVPLRFLITSRPNENVKAEFSRRALAQHTQEFPLSGIPNEVTTRDITLFLSRRLEEIRTRYPGLSPGWPTPEQLDQLVTLSESLFIFAATAALFVGDKRARDPEGRLKLLLESGNAAAAIGSSSTSPYRILDALYAQVLLRGVENLDAIPRAQLKRILGTITLAKEQLSPTTLEALLNLPPGTVRRLLSVLNAILAMPAPDDEVTPIRLIHHSFADFIVDPSRCTNRAFLVNAPIQRTVLAERCLRMLLSLRHNICEVDPKDDHLLNCEIPDLPTRIARFLPSALQYACKYWSYHLRRAEFDDVLLKVLKTFCDSHLLDWLEALSLMGCVDVAIEALHTAQLFLKRLPIPQTNVPALLYDCERITRAFYEGISASFFEVLRATAVFSPANSPLRRSAIAAVSNSIQLRHGGRKAWDTTLTSIDCGSAYVFALDFSPDGTTIACATRDGTIQLRSVQTGAQLHVFQRSDDWVMSVAFSPTGKTMLAGSVDGTVTTWDVATGACLGTWQRHSRGACCVAWCHDGALAASGSSKDRTVALWDVASPEEYTLLSSHTSSVTAVAFAPDGTLLSASTDKTCVIWDTRSKSLVRTLQHDNRVLCVSVSSDGRLVACGLMSGDITLWDKQQGRKLHTLAAPASVLSLTFYAYRSTLTAVYEDSTLSVWDLHRATPLTRLKTSHAGASSAAFSPDDARCAMVVGKTMVHITEWPADGAEELQQTGIPLENVATDNILQRTSKSVKEHASLRMAEQTRGDTEVGKALTVSISPDGSLVIAIYTHRVALLDVSTGEYVRSVERDSSSPLHISWAPTGSSAAWRDATTLCVWGDLKSEGASIRAYEHSAWIFAVCVAPDGKHVLFASSDAIHRLGIRQSPHPEAAEASSAEVLFRCAGEIAALALSSDGTRMLSTSWQNSPPETPGDVDLLELACSAHSQPAPATEPSSMPHSWHSTLRLHDASGRVRWLERHTSKLTSLAFSDDCTRALAGTGDGQVFLYDLAQSLCGASKHDFPATTPCPASTAPARRFSSGGTRQVDRVAFSPDGQGIVTERSYIPLLSENRPVARSTAANHSLPVTPAYFITDGWLWRSFGLDAEAGSCRLCWLPPALRPDEDELRNVWLVRGHVVAYKTQGGGVVVMDASRC
ncbi:hypothetical protein ACG7TL_005295 [Trametes sanguinea]